MVEVVVVVEVDVDAERGERGGRGEDNTILVMRICEVDSDK